MCMICNYLPTSQGRKIEPKTIHRCNLHRESRFIGQSGPRSRGVCPVGHLSQNCNQLFGKIRGPNRVPSSRKHKTRSSFSPTSLLTHRPLWEKVLNPTIPSLPDILALTHKLVFQSTDPSPVPVKSSRKHQKLTPRRRRRPPRAAQRSGSFTTAGTFSIFILFNECDADLVCCL